MPPPTPSSGLAAATRFGRRAISGRPTRFGRTVRFASLRSASTSARPGTRPCNLAPLSARISFPGTLGCCSTPRLYHSHDHPAPPGQFTETERALLAAAYRHVPQHGYSHEALALGARDAGYLDISASLLPDGIFTLIQWHLVVQREALAAKSNALFGVSQGTMQVPVLDKAEALTWERLRGNANTISKLQEALAVMAQPTYVPTSLKELALLVDEIWFLAGDKAVDPSWYTKRASLSAIYATTELFMTTDYSPDFRDTKHFLRRRFQEAGELGGAFRSVGEWLNFTATAGMNVLRSKGLNI